MKIFKVIYRETILHDFYVEAETEDNVNDEFCRMANDGELDFNDGYLIEGDIIGIEEI